MKYLFCSSGFGLLIFGMSAVVIASAQAEVQAAKTIKIGVALRFTPDVNSFAPSLYDGIEYAKQIVEAEHRELLFELVKYPHKSGHASVDAAAAKILADQVSYVIGGEMSDEAFALAESFHDAKVLFMTPTASNPLLTAGNPYVFRACYSDDQVAREMAKYAANLSEIRSIGVVHNTSNAYSDYVTNAFLDAFQASHANKNKVQIIEFRYAGEEPAFQHAVDQFKKASVDLVVAFTLQDQLTAFYGLAEKAKLHPIYLGSDGWGTNESLQKLIGADFKGIRNSYWMDDGKNQSVQSFKKGFEKKYGHVADAWNAIAYDSALSLMEAIAKTKNRMQVSEVADTLHASHFKKGATVSEIHFDRKNNMVKPLYLYEVGQKSIQFVKEMK